MKLQIVSDLHLEIDRPGHEFYDYEIKPVAEDLALLGDIGCTMDDRLFQWLEKQLRLFKRIFYVPGNHEFYQSTIEESIALLSNFAARVEKDASLGSFILLNNTRFDVNPRLSILGCTLWSSLHEDDLDILSWAVNDFKRISNFNPKAFNALHAASLAWLNATVHDITSSEPEREVVILTHHAPSVEGTSNPEFKERSGGGYDPMQSAFSTDLAKEECWTSANVKFWGFGHTHWSCDVVQGGVRLYSNQRGYGESAAGYDATKVVEFK